MMSLAMFINGLKAVDIVFFIVCVALVAIAVGIYFLIPVLNKKQYKEQRENLRKREEAFKSNALSRAQANQETAPENTDSTTEPIMELNEKDIK